MRGALFPGCVFFFLVWFGGVSRAGCFPYSQRKDRPGDPHAHAYTPLLTGTRSHKMFIN